MGRYDFWTPEELKTLKEKTLFWDYLLPDIKNGVVFAALRGKQIHFYHQGCKLFGYLPSSGFQTNAAFVVALKEEQQGEVKERDLDTLKLIPDFVQGYEQIKKNTSLYRKRRPEAGEVYDLCKTFSFGKTLEKLEGQIVVLDIELSLESYDEGKSTDQIDLVLYDRESYEIRFFEVKLLSDSRLRPLKNQTPEVISQLYRYNNQIEKRRNGLLEDYKEYIKKMSTLLDLVLPLPQEIAPDVELLLFGFGSSQKDKDKVKTVVSTIERNNFCCSSLGSASSAGAPTLRKWWRSKYW